MLWPLVQVSSSSRAAMEQCDRFWDGQGGSIIVGALGEGSSQLSRAGPRKFSNLRCYKAANAPEITKRSSRMSYLGVTAIKRTHSSYRVAFIICVQRAFLSTLTSLLKHHLSLLLLRPGTH